MKRIIGFFVAIAVSFFALIGINAKAEGNAVVADFSTVQTKSSLKLSYNTETSDINSLSLRFGGMIEKKLYDEASTYGVIVVAKEDEHLLDEARSYKDEALKGYALAMDAVRVNKDRQEDPNGDFYQFAWVITNMEGHYTFDFVAAMFKENNDGLVLAKRAYENVASVTNKYLNSEVSLGDSLAKAFNKLLDNNLLEVSFKGTKLNKEAVRCGGVATRPEDPAKPGYSFKGWYLNKEPYDFNTPVTKNIELEAVFELNDYKYSIELLNDTLIIKGSTAKAYYNKNIKIEFEAEGVELDKRIPSQVENDPSKIKYTPKYILSGTSKIDNSGLFEVRIDLRGSVINYNLYGHISIYGNDMNDILYPSDNKFVDMEINRCETALETEVYPSDRVKLFKSISSTNNEISYYAGDLYGRLGLYIHNPNYGIEYKNIDVVSDSTNIYYEISGTYYGYTKDTLELFYDIQSNGVINKNPDGTARWDMLVDRALIDNISFDNLNGFKVRINVSKILEASFLANKDIKEEVYFIHFGTDMVFDDIKGAAGLDKVSLNGITYSLVSDSTTFDCVGLKLEKEVLAKHTVTFLDSDGTEISTALVTDGAGVEAPVINSKDAGIYVYDFNGFDKVIPDSIHEDMTFTATYKKNPKDYIYTLEFANDLLIINGNVNPKYNGMRVRISWEFPGGNVNPVDEAIINGVSEFAIEINLLELNQNKQGFAHIAILDSEGKIVFGGDTVNLLIDRNLTELKDVTISGTDISHAVEFVASNKATYYAGNAWDGLMLYGINYNKAYTFDRTELSLMEDGVHYTVFGNYSGYTSAEMQAIKFNVQHNSNVDSTPGWEYFWGTNPANLALDELNFTFKFDINISSMIESKLYESNLYLFSAVVHLGTDFNGSNADIKGSSVVEQNLEYHGLNYRLYQDDRSFNTPGVDITIKDRKASIANVNGRAIVTITGYTPKNQAFFNQLLVETNGIYNHNTNWIKTYVPSTISVENNILVATMDITDLGANGYLTKMQDQNNDWKNAQDVRMGTDLDSSITIGNRTYRIYAKAGATDGESFFGLLGIIVTNN